MSGRIPNELVEEAENGEVHVDIEDHKEEEYQKPKGASGVKAFSGTGHTLGGISPAVSSAPPPVSTEDSHSLEAKAQGNILEQFEKRQFFELSLYKQMLHI